MCHTRSLFRLLTILFSFSTIFFAAPKYSAQTCAPAPSGIVGWWQGEGNANDLVGGNNGTLVNGVSFVTGIVGQGFNFDGANGYVLIGNPSNLKLTSAVTLEAWVKPGNLVDGQQADVISKWGQSTSLDSYLMFLSKQGGVINLAGAIGVAGVSDQGFSGGNLPANSWSHVAMTYDATTGINSLYVNGQQVATRTWSGGIFTSDINVLIGREDSALARPFLGLIDEPSIYNRALSASEIQAIYNAGSAGKCNTNATPTPVKTTCRIQSSIPPNTFSFPSPYFDANGLVIPVKNVSGSTQTAWVFDITAYDDSCNSRNTSFATTFFSVENNTSVELYANPIGVYHLRKSDGTEIVSADYRNFPHTSVGFDLFNGSITVGASSDSWRVSTTTPTPTPTPIPTPTPTPTPQQRPLIFIPGIAGSQLFARTISGPLNNWPSPALGSTFHPISPYGFISLAPNEQYSVFAPDILRDNPYDVYKTLLFSLENNLSYHEYALKLDDPSRLTSAGCDRNQKSDDPNKNPSLFIFPYDWRKSNADNANLLADYVQCVRYFYPTGKIDILTHSMGGLVARRYIATTQNKDNIGKLITVAAPWLGAPKAINVLETGAFLDDWKQLLTNAEFKERSEFFLGEHELLPSSKYFELGGRPLNLNGQDVTDPNTFVRIMDQRFPRSTPGSKGNAFHQYPDQDDERTNPSKYRTKACKAFEKQFAPASNPDCIICAADSRSHDGRYF